MKRKTHISSALCTLMAVRAAASRAGRVLSLKMISDPVNNLQIRLLEGPDSLINFALSKKFDEHLSLPWPGRRIWEELEFSEFR
jgi:hypothetical protein